MTVKCITVFIALVICSVCESRASIAAGEAVNNVVSDAFIGLHDVGINLSPEQYVEISQAGVSIIRSNAAVWNVVEKKKGFFNFEAADYTYVNASKNNIDVVFTLMAPPKWARSSKKKYKGPQYLAMTSDLKGWGNYCRKIMIHFKGKVKYWEIWNEPNAPKTWFKGGSPSDFVKLMKIAYTIAKEVDPNNLIVMGGVVGPDIEKKHDGEGFFEMTLKLGVSNWLDVYAVHYTANKWDRYSWFKELIEKLGDTSKPIWNSEESYSKGDRNIELSLLSAHYIQKMDKVFYYLAKDYAWMDKHKELRGIYDKNGNKKWSFFVLKYLSGFLSSKLLSFSDRLEDGSLLFAFVDKLESDSRNIYVIASTHPRFDVRLSNCEQAEFPRTEDSMMSSTLYFKCLLSDEQATLF